MASCVGIPKSSSGTFAFIIVIASWGADCHHAAGVGVTGVSPLNTFLVPALVATVAVGINLIKRLCELRHKSSDQKSSYHTLRPTSGDCVRLGDKSWLTSANWVSILIDGAGGSRSTRGWVARIRFLNASEEEGLEKRNEKFNPIFTSDFHKCSHIHSQDLSSIQGHSQQWYQVWAPNLAHNWKSEN